MVGGALRNSEDKCLEDVPFCDTVGTCPGGCAKCDADPCNGYVETGCTKKGTESSTSTGISFDISRWPEGKVGCQLHPSACLHITRDHSRHHKKSQEITGDEGPRPTPLLSPLHLQRNGWMGRH